MYNWFVYSFRGPLDPTFMIAKQISFHSISSRTASPKRPVPSCVLISFRFHRYTSVLRAPVKVLSSFPIDLPVSMRWPSQFSALCRISGTILGFPSNSQKCKFLKSNLILIKNCFNLYMLLRRMGFEQCITIDLTIWRIWSNWRSIDIKTLLYPIL